MEVSVCSDSDAGITILELSLECFTSLVILSMETLMDGIEPLVPEYEKG